MSDESIFCAQTTRCQSAMRWSKIEQVIKECLQQVFDRVGLGAGEKTYHDAVFAQLCRQKHLFECAHVRCSLHSETVAPITLERDQLPCGFMRSDIAIEWTASTKKRKAIANGRATRNVCVLELKATASPLASAAVTQLLCYMRAYNAQYGLVCNFLQRCDSVQKAMNMGTASLRFKQKNNLLLFDHGGVAVKVAPGIETYTVELQNESD